MTLLLDSCAFIWLVSAPEHLSARAIKALDEPTNERALSLATVWEITLKHHTGKLPLPSPPAVWIEEQIRLQDIEVLPLQREVLESFRSCIKIPWIVSLPQRLCIAGCGCFLRIVHLRCMGAMCFGSARNFQRLAVRHELSLAQIIFCDKKSV